MLLIHRSILKELLLSFLLSVVFLNFTLMMERLLKLSRILSEVGASVLDFAQIIIYLQPQIFIFTIPMAMLLSTLLTYGRLNADNELIILKNSGMSFGGISKPVVYLGIACFIASLSISFYLGPKGGTILREEVSQILTTKAPAAIKEGIFNTMFNDITILVKEKPSPDRLSEIFIVDERRKDKQKIIIAKEGSITPKVDSLSFSLTNGSIYITGKDSFTQISFSRYYFRLDPFAEPVDKRKRDMTPIELIRSSQEYPDRKIQFFLELHRRLTMPALCLMIILLGPSLSLMAGRSGRLGGFTAGISVFIAYYVILLYGENLAESGKIPHFIGAWLPFATLGTLAMYAFWRTNKR